MPPYETSVSVTADTTLVTTAETVIATLPGCSTSGPGKKVTLAGEFQITTGTNTTGMTVRIRRDSLTGTLVDEANVVQIETAAGNTEDHDIEVVDTPTGEIYNATYVLTVQQVAASANGSVLRALLRARCE